MSAIRSIHIYLALILCGMLLASTPAQAYHFPWDQGHDTFNWNDPPDPGTCEESTCDSCKSTGSPVYIPNGQFVWSDTDFTLNGRPDMGVRRTYNSQDARDGLFGNGWSVSFDIALYQAVEAGITSEYILRTSDGKRYIFIKQNDGSVLAPAGRFETVVPQSDGSVQLVFQDSRAMTFRQDGKLLFDSDPNGNTLSIAYNDDDQMVEISDGNGRSLTFAYTGAGRISHVTDHAGRDWRYDYDTNGNLVSVTDPLGGVRRYEYIPYKATGDGYTYQYLTKIIDPTDVVAIQVVYSGGRVQSYTEGSNKYTYSYNATTKQITKTDLMGSRWVYTYNDQAIITNLVNPLNYQTSYVYDSNGLLTQMSDPLGKTWTSTYDRLGRLLTSSNPLNETKTFEYPGTSPHPGKLKTPSGRVYTFTYDSQGNLTSATNPAGAQGKYTWNDQGDMVTLINTLGNKQTITYNPIGLSLSVTDALDRTESYSYDNLGNLIQATNQAGETTSSSYDALGRVASVTNPLGDVTSFTYDAAGRLSRVTNPSSGVTGYSYDGYGRLIEKTSPDGRKQSFTYRTDNLLGSTTDPKGQATTYTYDADKRLTQENAAGQITSYTYSARNELTSTTNTSGTVSSVYDDAGRLIQETNNGKIIQYTYNAEGQRLSFTALGMTTNYAYDNCGLLASITGPSGVFAFTYDLMGRQTRLQYPNDNVASYQYDATGQLSGMVTTGIVNTNYGYERDGVGRIIRWSGDGSDWYYQYDAAGRLTRGEHSAESFFYTYDALGNILDNGRTHDIANRLLQDNDYAYTYDLNGNLTQKQHKTTGARSVYTWNVRNQLTRVDRHADATSTIPNKTLTFSYDSLGRRMSKTEDGVTERYVYDDTNLIGVLDVSGNVLVSYTFGPKIDEPLSMNGNGKTYYFYGNHQGSIMALSTDSQMVNQYEYDPYGRTQVTGDETLSRFRYTAREQDADDLYYYRARYYDPTAYRFISEDPIGLQAGLNVYAYVQNNPINLNDPSGLSADTCCKKDYLACLADCISKYDPLNPESKIGLSALGATFPKSWVGLPRGLGGASRFTTVPSVVAHFTGGGAAGTVGALARGLGRVVSPIWIVYGNYLFAMEVYCAATCAQNSCAH